MVETASAQALLTLRRILAPAVSARGAQKGLVSKGTRSPYLVIFEHQRARLFVRNCKTLLPRPYLAPQQ